MLRVVTLVVIGLLLIVMPVFAQDTTPIAPTPTGPVINLDKAAQGAVTATENAAQATLQTANDLITRLVHPPQTEVLRVLLVVGGVLLLVAGWRIYEYVILIAGFLIGAAFALALVGEQSAVVSIAAFLVGGVIGAALCILLYYVAIFLIGAYIGIVLTQGLATLLALGTVSPIVLFIGALLGGVILIGLSFELLILLAIIVGAQMLSLGLGLGTEWTLIFAIAGLVIQFFLARYTGYQWRRRPAWRHPLRRARAEV